MRMDVERFLEQSQRLSLLSMSGDCQKRHWGLLVTQTPSCVTKSISATRPSISTDGRAPIILFLCSWFDVHMHVCWA